MRILLIHFLLISILSTSFGQENCSLRKDQDGIKVYLCETEGSSFKTIKVQFEAKGTLKTYASGVLNMEGYKEWQNSILNIYMLARINELELIYYSEVDTPWPVSNRDLIFHLKMNQDSITKTLTVSLEQLPTYISPKEGIVRIPKAESILTLVPLDATYVKVNYTLNVNPGGEVPAFIANMFAAQTPWQTFSNFRDRLHAENFSKVDVSFISNFTP